MRESEGVVIRSVSGLLTESLGGFPPARESRRVVYAEPSSLGRWRRTDRTGQALDLPQPGNRPGEAERYDFH